MELGYNKNSSITCEHNTIQTGAENRQKVKKIQGDIWKKGYLQLSLVGKKYINKPNHAK